MVPLIITLLQWEFIVTTRVIFFSVYVKIYETYFRKKLYN